MSDREEKIRETIGLLLVWGKISGRFGGLHWPKAASVLEEKINQLCDELFPDEVITPDQEGEEHA